MYLFTKIGSGQT
jgi:hypothetical protein